MTQQDPPPMMQVHPTETLTTPEGEDVQVDRGMAGLVRALWDVGMSTLQSCQDAGASIYGGGWLYPPHRRVRYAAFWDGFAWLKMPDDDAARLLTLAKPILEGRGWECTSPFNTSHGRLPVANLYFPADQIAELHDLLRTAP